MRPTLAQVNKALATAGVTERLVRGNGYFYFTEGTADSWHTSSTMVYRIGQLTVAQWCDEHARLKLEHDKVTEQ